MRIFLSYAREDRASVDVLAEDLTELELSVWYDKKLLGGQDWWDVILEQIRLCDLYLFALTPRSIASEACKHELQYANDLRRPLLPVKLDHVSDALLPPQLHHAQQVDYRRFTKHAALKLCAALLQMPPAPPLPDPLPAPPRLPVSGLWELKVRLDDARPMSHPEQVAMVEGLWKEAQVTVQWDDVYGLFDQFRRRSDLLHNTAPLIEARMWSMYQTRFPPAPEKPKKMGELLKRGKTALLPPGPVAAPMGVPAPPPGFTPPPPPSEGAARVGATVDLPPPDPAARLTAGPWAAEPGDHATTPSPPRPPPRPPVEGDGGTAGPA